MTDRPTLDYQPPEPHTHLRTSDYVVATLGGILVFVGALFAVILLCRMAFPDVGGMGEILVGVGILVLPLAAAASSFYSSLKTSRARRSRKS
ncbi:MAG: hypothetical protein JWO31_1590 [Phycisphaerales bacterium]|nr:hypothetical protein [Phycisphaerales bacterium]